MRVPVPDEIVPADRLGRVHFVGIGGAGLSGIARIMLARGIAVSGSDANDSPALAALRGLGARVDLGHDAAHVDDADTVVVSTAVREDNPEYAAAVQRGLRVLPRSAALAAVMAGRRVVAVAGTHGKTTTTSLLTVALQAAGADPTYAVGGDLAQHRHQRRARAPATCSWPRPTRATAPSSSTARTPRSSPTSRPTTSTTGGPRRPTARPSTSSSTTLDRDGFLVCCVDDDGAAALAETARSQGLAVIGVGESAAADLRCTDLTFRGTTSGFDVHDGDRHLGRITLAIPGRHYVLDALAALAVGLRLGFAFDDLRRGLEDFTGTRRRMERKGEAAGVRVYDSYAHHPVEIAGDLQAGRAPSRATAVWSSPSSPTWSRAPGSSARPWARRSVPPTRSWCSTSTSRARTPTRR